MTRIAILSPLIVGILSITTYAEPLTHETAPALSDQELGHLRNFVHLARQKTDDFTGWEGKDQKGMESYRYQIAFMTYALSLQQYHSVPAYRDLYSDAIDRLIVRMLEKPVWDFWEEVSKGSTDWDPDHDADLSGTKDPVGEKNIMYSGHLLHMVALYETLYRDMKWSKPNALTFRWNDDLAFEYDYAELIEIVHQEMLAPRLEGGLDKGAMECEPNLVFPECNQHPALAFELFDYLRNTDYAARTMPAFKNFFKETEMHHPETHHTQANYRIKQNNTLNMPPRGSASADGWTGAFMHVWEPDYIKSLYQKQRDDYIARDEKTGEIRLTPDPTRDLSPAFFANLAMELGDTETAQLLFDYVDKHYASQSDDQGFRLVRNMGDKKFPANNTTDKLMGLARSNRPNGLWKLHNEPWGDLDRIYPLVAKVDFPNVLVRQAVWDADYETLLFILEPLNGGKTRTTFRIENIPTNMIASLDQEGKLIAAIDEHAQASGTLIKNLDPGVIQITTTLNGPTQFTLKAE
jgi:hypothetical protein